MRYSSALRCNARLTLVVFAAAIVLGIAASAASASGVTVEVLPQALTPRAGGERSIMVIARNDGPAATHVALSVLRGTTNSEYRLKQAPEAAAPWTLDKLAKGEDRSWQVQMVTPARYLPGTVYFLVTYVAAGRTRIASAPFDVQGVAQTKLEDVATVDIKTTLNSLDDKHDGYVYLMVTNKSAVDIRVANVRPDKLDFVDFSTPGKAIIGPRQTKAVAVKVTPKDRVRPGEYLLVFHVPISWYEGYEKKTAEVIATQPTKIGVYGESEILKVVGAPLLLFLPGVLIVTAFALAWLVTDKDGPKGFSAITPTSVVAGVLGVSLSLPMAYVVPRLGGPDYISGYYGFDDLVWLWFLSLALGFGLGLLWYLVLVKLGAKLWGLPPARHAS